MSRKSLNMSLPWGHTAACDLEKLSRVMGILSTKKRRGGGRRRREGKKKHIHTKKKEGLSEDVRRRKRSRNINRKGLRSGLLLYMEMAASSFGLVGTRGDIN